MPRLFCARDISYIQRLQVRYASECKVPNKVEVEKFGQGFQAILLRFKAKPLPPKQSVKFKCQI